MNLLPPPSREEICVSLIGMPGAGKSTIGQLLARQLQWALLDTDYLIEAAYGLPLQAITDTLGKEAFLDVEADVVASVRARRTVLATGGSVVYRECAMQRLRELGPVVYLDVPFAAIEERVARNPQRGLAIAPGQTLQDIYRERAALYTRYATVRVDMTVPTPAACAEHVLDALHQAGFLPA